MDKIRYTRGCFLDKIGCNGCFHVREKGRGTKAMGGAPCGRNRARKRTKAMGGAWCMVDKTGHFPNVGDTTGHTRVFCDRNHPPFTWVKIKIKMKVCQKGHTHGAEQK